jgi:preprotein translocase subunit SecG
MLQIIWYFLMVVYLIACFGLIAVVLLQKGKGTGFAGAFGIGPGSDTVFGPRASKSLPVRMTYIMAGLFVVLSLTMSLLGGWIVKGQAPDKAPEIESAGMTALEERGLQDAPGEAEAAEGGSGEAAAPAAEGTESATPAAEETEPSDAAADSDSTEAKPESEG